MLCDPLTPVVMNRGKSLIIPPLFDGDNYAYWQVHMRTFLQSLDEKVWLAIEVGWTKPIEPQMSWDVDKIKATNFNNRVMNALFSVVTNKEFKKISSTETAKEAWTILLLRGKFFLFPNRIWGSQAETQRWAFEIKPKGYRRGVSPPNQEIEAAP